MFDILTAWRCPFPVREVLAGEAIRAHDLHEFLETLTNSCEVFLPSSAGPVFPQDIDGLHIVAAEGADFLFGPEGMQAEFPQGMATSTRSNASRSIAWAPAFSSS